MLNCWDEECKTIFTKENATSRSLMLPWQQELTSDAIVKAAGYVHVWLLGAEQGRGWAQDPIMREMGKCTQILVTKTNMVTSLTCKRQEKKTKCILPLHDILHRRLLKHSSLPFLDSLSTVLRLQSPISWAIWSAQWLMIRRERNKTFHSNWL